jgi:hypothetical protein
MVWNGRWNPDLEKETENNRRESIPLVMKVRVGKNNLNEYLFYALFIMGIFVCWSVDSNCQVWAKNAKFGPKLGNSYMEHRIAESES